MKILRNKWLLSLFIVLACCNFFENNVFCTEKDSEKGEIMTDLLEKVRIKASDFLLLEDPEGYKITPYRDLWLKGRPVFSCMDECGYSVVLAKDDEDGWIRLSGVGDFSGMNKVLKDYLFPKGALNDTKSLLEFSYTFYKLYRNTRGEILSKKFIKKNSENDFFEWLSLDMNIEHLKALCIDPVAKAENDIITIKFNVLTSFGAVECWILHGKHMNDQISIERVTISVLKPTNSYSYPYMM